MSAATAKAGLAPAPAGAAHERRGAGAAPEATVRWNLPQQ